MVSVYYYNIAFGMEDANSIAEFHFVASAAHLAEVLKTFISLHSLQYYILHSPTIRSTK